MKRLILACIVLSACETTTGTSPIDKTLQDLAVACVGGNQSACDAYSDLYDQRPNQSAAAPVAPVYAPVAPVFQPIQLEPFPQMTGPQRTVCQPQYGQQVVCNTY